MVRKPVSGHYTVLFSATGAEKRSYALKKIVLFCDGTWNRADQEEDDQPCPTNVVRLGYRVAAQDADGLSQIVYYDQGVGTGNLLDKFTGGAFGRGLDDNVYAAYRFLVSNFSPGDQLFLFGFSRGAFTARSLAGMIRKCGILQRRFVYKYPDAVALYRSGEHPDEAGPKAFRRQYGALGAETVPIHFIGVWDTVGSLGIPLRGLRGLTMKKYQFHDTELSGSVRFAYHALAIDERRSPFEPTLWAPIDKPGQTVEQVWFSGVHSDVGGGYRQREVSDIALQWMMDKAAAANGETGTGLALDGAVDQEPPLALTCTGADCELHQSKTGWYRLTRGIDREIGIHRNQVDATQSIHPSVLQRWDRDPGYRPKNLRSFLRSVGDPRAG